MSVDGARVVVTGIGAVSAYGWSSRELWQGLSAGRVAIQKPERFSTAGQRTEIASEVPPAPAELSDHFPDWSTLAQADRFALAAAEEAARAASLAPGSEELGVYFGGSTAGMQEAERYFLALLGRSEERPRLRWVASQPLNSPGDAVARYLRVSGQVLSLSSACASGALAIGAAVEAIRRGRVDVAVAGGSDALCLLTYAGFNSLRAVDEQSCRPFRQERAGLSLGEGAGVLVLESLHHALDRGVEPLAELRGAGASCDAYHMTAPDPEGKGAAAAILSALRRARLEPETIDFVNAHGTGTPLNDLSEWHALVAVLGERAHRVPVTSTKSMIGHLLGSAGAIEAVATIQCLREGCVHPTAGSGAVDPETGVDLVVDCGRPTRKDGHALSTSFAFGGANAALVISGLTEKTAA